MQLQFRLNADQKHCCVYCYRLGCDLEFEIINTGMLEEMDLLAIGCVFDVASTSFDVSLMIVADIFLTESTGLRARTLSNS